jgi:putative membrane-bound dehydrogenase-like protein
MRFSLVALLVTSSAAFGQLDPAAALKSMQPGPGLQVELFASEPMLINPTAIDVDHVGRVWVAEAVNYRRKNFGRPIIRKEGDRIQILIDTDGDGKADEAKTFYQGEEVIAPLSVLVLPQADGKALRVLVAQSPDILEFWDKDGDLKADGPPTKFLSGFGGFDHDHGVHGLTVGPDGKLYFTVGDSGVKNLQSKNGKGKAWTTNTTDCQKGTVWRVDLDGNNLELIAHNFRNNYEACVDSFGEIWCSDNDDDGNQQTRICFVMPGGNYGYGPRGPGQSHWHEEQPGIVHKTLRTGFGSPTGICFYEGNLLPKQYQGDLIHCDAGPREVRYFKRIPKGAGYDLEKTVMLTSSDNWFRPSDCCVAPDGSVFVSDWYDPGVGGHGMGDSTRGRIYRLVPTGHKGYDIAKYNHGSKTGIINDIVSPCNANRASAMAAITTVDNPSKTIDSLAAMGPLLRARGRMLEPSLPGFDENAWIKANLEGKAIHFSVQQPYFAKLLLSHVSKLSTALKHVVTSLNEDIDLCTITLHKVRSSFSRDLLLCISQVKDVEAARMSILHLMRIESKKSKEFLSAINIACGEDAARRDSIFRGFEIIYDQWDDNVADLVWELRPKSMLPKMGPLLNDPKLTDAQKGRIVDILAVNDDLSAGRTLLAMLGEKHPAAVTQKAVDNLVLFVPTKWKELTKEPAFGKAVRDLFAADRVGPALALAPLTGDATLFAAIMNSCKDKPERFGPAAKAIAAYGTPAAVEQLKVLLMASGYAKVDPAPVVDAIGTVVAAKANQPAGQEAMKLLQSLLVPETDAESQKIARDAITALAGSRAGTGWLLKQHEEKKLPAIHVSHAARLLRNSPFQGERNKALLLFPVAAKLDKAKLPSLAELAKRPGDAKAGEALMLATAGNDMQCLKCHRIHDKGGMIGPDLSAIGTKGSKENLFESLLDPSKAIADQYVTWVVELKDGATVQGLLIKETETNLTIRDANGIDTLVDIKNVEARKKSLVSLMSPDLVTQFTEQELIDMVAYLATLKAGK